MKECRVDSEKKEENAKPIEKGSLSPEKKRNSEKKI